MSDLLASLVDRALDRAPVLQRRQPTRFEPISDAAFSPRTQVVTAAPLAEEDTFVERDRAPTPPASEFRSRVSGFQQRPASEDTHRGDNEPQQFPSRATLNEAPHISVERRSEHSEPPREPIRAKASADQFSPEAPSNRSLVPRASEQAEQVSFLPPRMIETIVEKRVEREIVSQPSTVTPTTREPMPIDRAVAQRKPASEEDGMAPQPLRVKSKPSVTKDEPGVKPLIRKRQWSERETSPLGRAAARVEANRSIKQSAPPAIQITIGRVEVRATPQPSARQKTTAMASGPRVSLEDYLRLRGERS